MVPEHGILMANKQPSKKIVLSKTTAGEFRFKSFLDHPMSELTEFQRSLLLAECAMISYLPIQECNIAAGKLGFVDGKFFNSGNAQAYWFQSEHDSVVVFRGTEPTEWGDIQADANALTAVAETIGKVHRGFKAEVDELWPYIEEALAENTKPLWITGHSLGGAMATICTGRCLISHIRSEPSELHTFGSPRVGCKKYVNFSKVPHYRWVNNNDIVTRVPPIWMGYRHSGQEMYINRHGKLESIQGWRRFSDRLQGFLGGLLKLQIDQFSDHSILEYIDVVYGLLRDKGLGPAKKQAASSEAESATEETTEKVNVASDSVPKPASASASNAQKSTPQNV